MKLLFCKKCCSVINLVLNKEKYCDCGETAGKYTDRNNAEYSGKHAVPFAIDNASFFCRVKGIVAKDHNKIYDQFYGKGRIQTWLLEKGSTNFETIKKVNKKRKLGWCGAKH